MPGRFPFRSSKFARAPFVSPTEPLPETKSAETKVSEKRSADLARSETMARFFETRYRYLGHLAWIKNEIGDSKILVWLLAPLVWAGGLGAMQMDQYVIAIMFFLAAFGLVAIKAVGATKDREQKVLVFGLAILFSAAHVVWVMYTHKQFDKRAKVAEAVTTPSITISPGTMSLISTKGHKSIYEVLVHNPTTIACFEVKVKVTMDSPAIEAKKIEIHRIGGTPINVAPDPAEALDNMLVIEPPAPGGNSLSFWAGRLMPSQTKRYVVSYQNDGELPEGIEHQLTFSLDRFTTTPTAHGSYPVR